MLRVNLRELRHGPVETQAELAADDPAFQGLDLALEAPVRVTGRLQETAEGEYFWRAQLATRVTGECRRCLTDVHQDVATEVDVLFSADPESADDPSVYPLDPNAQHLDLGEVVREELALAVPAFPLCRESCAGLCPRCGADLNAGACSCAPGETQ